MGPEGPAGAAVPSSPQHQPPADVSCVRSGPQFVASKKDAPSSSSPLMRSDEGSTSTVLQFLPLRDCLTFACVSRECLEKVLPELSRRRRIQFLTRHREEPPHEDGWLALRPEEDGALADGDAAAAFGGNGNNDDEGARSSTFRGCQILSVRERVDHLCGVVPATHPLHDDIERLAADFRCVDPLRQGDPTVTGGEGVGTSSSNDDAATTGRRVAQLRAVTAAHRLHASLSGRCTIRLDPRDIRADDRRPDPARLTVTLEQYMGDVLSACHLSAHSLACLVEGGPPYSGWIEHLDSFPRYRTSLQWYHLWVYHHSTMLRSMPYTAQQARLLGLAPLTGYMFSPPPLQQDGGSEEWWVPPLCFSTTEYLRADRTRLPKKQGSIRSVFFDSDWYADLHGGSHETVLSEFGPLGPAFRGRDRLTQIVMRPFDVARHMTKMTQLSPPRALLTHGEVQEGCVVVDLSVQPTWIETWIQGDHPIIRWMMRLQDELVKTRPMTVAPPLVVIQSTQYT